MIHDAERILLCGGAWLIVFFMAGILALVWLGLFLYFFAAPATAAAPSATKRPSVK